MDGAVGGHTVPSATTIGNGHPGLLEYAQPFGNVTVNRPSSIRSEPPHDTLSMTSGIKRHLSSRNVRCVARLASITSESASTPTNAIQQRHLPVENAQPAANLPSITSKPARSPANENRRSSRKTRSAARLPSSPSKSARSPGNVQSHPPANSMDGTGISQPSTPDPCSCGPEHYCFWPRCCSRFRGELPLLAKKVDHLPICHEPCWRVARNRLVSSKVTAEERRRYKLCHRTCYENSLWKIANPGSTKAGVVPPNRRLKEKLRLYELKHWFGW
jgi:hypothetical protein